MFGYMSSSFNSIEQDLIVCVYNVSILCNEFWTQILSNQAVTLSATISASPKLSGNRDAILSISCAAMRARYILGYSQIGNQSEFTKNTVHCFVFRDRAANQSAQKILRRLETISFPVLSAHLGGVYMIPDRVSFRYDFIPVPY